MTAHVSWKISAHETRVQWSVCFRETQPPGDYPYAIGRASSSLRPPLIRLTFRNVRECRSHVAKADSIAEIYRNVTTELRERAKRSAGPSPLERCGLLTAILCNCHFGPTARAAEARPWRRRFASSSASFPVSHSRGLTSPLSLRREEAAMMATLRQRRSASETAGRTSTLRESLREDSGSPGRVHRVLPRRAIALNSPREGSEAVEYVSAIFVSARLGVALSFFICRLHGTASVLGPTSISLRVF